jgi:hypothetical protein
MSIYRLLLDLLRRVFPRGNFTDVPTTTCKLPGICWCLGRKHAVNRHHEGLLKSRIMLNQKATTLFNNLHSRLFPNYNFLFLANLPFLRKESRVLRSPCCLCVLYLNFWKGTPILTKIGLVVMPSKATRIWHIKFPTTAGTGIAQPLQRRTAGLMAGARHFSVLHSSKTRSGPHPASYPMGTGGSFPEGKA